MKKIVLISLSAVLFAACGGNSNTTTDAASTENVANNDMFFGEKITEENAIALADLKTQMGESTELEVKLTGTVHDVCQKKGCWMELTDEAGNNIRVTFKDYGFFMPKDCSGKTAIINGVAKVEETSVADLQEYASDAGQSKEEIAAIKEPKKELVFEASGVILR